MSANGKEAAAPATPSSAASAGKSPVAAVDTRVYTIVGENRLGQERTGASYCHSKFSKTNTDDKISTAREAKC